MVSLNWIRLLITANQWATIVSSKSVIRTAKVAESKAGFFWIYLIWTRLVALKCALLHTTFCTILTKPLLLDTFLLPVEIPPLAANFFLLEIDLEASDSATTKYCSTFTNILFRSRKNGREQSWAWCWRSLVKPFYTQIRSVRIWLVYPWVYTLIWYSCRNTASFFSVSTCSSYTNI